MHENLHVTVKKRKFLIPGLKKRSERAIGLKSKRGGQTDGLLKVTVFEVSSNILENGEDFLGNGPHQHEESR